MLQSILLYIAVDNLEKVDYYLNFILQIRMFFYNLDPKKLFEKIRIRIRNTACDPITHLTCQNIAFYPNATYLATFCVASPYMVT